MSGNTLIFVSDALLNLEAAIRTARTSLDDTVPGTLESVARITADWLEGSGSRQAERQFVASFDDRLTQLTGALAGLESAIARVREKGREAEIRNVAIMD